MPVASLEYRFAIPLAAGADAAFAWCTDFGPADGPLFSQRTIRTVRRLNADAVIMTDRTFPKGVVRRIRRLVRIFPAERAWTNTHLDGPFRGSQYWYRVAPDGPGRSHLEFRGLRLEIERRPSSAAEIARRAEACRRVDSTEWRTHLAPALARDLASLAPAAARPGIRDFSIADLSRVRRLWRTAGIAIGPSDARSEMRRALERDPDLALVAERRGRIVGAVLGRFDGRRGWINHLAVEPGVRRSGIGAALVAVVEERLAGKGCPKVNLHVVPGNDGAAAFYARLGYRRAALWFFEKWLRGSTRTATPRRTGAGTGTGPGRPAASGRRRRSGARPR